MVDCDSSTSKVGWTDPKSQLADQSLALVLNVLRNVERGHSETDASATTNTTASTFRESAQYGYTVEAGRSAEPGPNDPGSVITQSRGGDRDHASRGMQGWDDAALERLKGGKRDTKIG